MKRKPFEEVLPKQQHQIEILLKRHRRHWKLEEGWATMKKSKSEKRRKREEEGRRKKEEGRRKKEEGRSHRTELGNWGGDWRKWLDDSLIRSKVGGNVNWKLAVCLDVFKQSIKWNLNKGNR
jgi:hypothetical protein